MEEQEDRITKTAKILKKIASEKIGRKSAGNYRISREHLLILSGKKTFCDDDIKQFQSKLHINGLIFVDLGTKFAVIQEKKLDGFIQVTKKIVEKYKPATKQKPTKDDEKGGKSPKKTIKTKSMST